MINEDLAHYNNSLIHKIDPSIRIICAFVLSIAISLSNDFTILGTYLFLSFLIIIMACLNPVEVFKRLKPVFLFILMIWFVLPLTYEGKILWSVGPINITKPGVELCVKITLKSISILIIFTALLATMTIPTMGHALQRLYLPDKFIFLFLMTYRYIAVIQGEYQRLLRAAKLRGFKPGTNIHSYKTYAYLAGMLFVRASCRAERIHKAMLCRGFHGKFHTLDTFSSNMLNSLFMASISAVTILLIFTENFWL